jgi:hypothetical protein
MEVIHPDGAISARLDNNRLIEFNPNEHRHLDHGHAVISHRSQGLTAERVVVHADSSVHPDLLNSRIADVSISRGSHEATLFPDDMAKLGSSPRLPCLKDLCPGNLSSFSGPSGNWDGDFIANKLPEAPKAAEPHHGKDRI